MADSVPILFTELSTIGGLSLACIGAVTFIVKVAQDKREFRRKQAESARLLIRDVYDTAPSMAALNMLDYASLTYDDLARNRQLFLTQEDVVFGLRSANVDELSAGDIYVRDCFDALFLKLEQLASLLSVKYICWEDVSAVLGYYLFLIRRDSKLMPMVTNYAKIYGFPRVAAMIDDANKYPVDKFRGADETMGERRPPDAAAPAS